jgi:ABC-type lipoprotein export system ATPase subunit
MSKSFRVLRIEGENVKNMKFFDMTPKSDVNVIAGKNGSGKSSFLSAIDFILKGKAGFKFSPVRNGTDVAKGKMEIGDEKVEFTIERTLKKDGACTLKLVTGDNMRPNSQQSVIDGLIGNVSFDPVAFVVGSDGSGRIKLLKEITGMDFSMEEDKYAELYDERKIQNRKLRDVEGEIKQYGDIPAELKKVRPIEVIQKEYEDIIEHNNFVDSHKKSMELEKNRIGEAKDEISDLKKKIDRLESFIVNSQASVEIHKEEIKNKKIKDTSKVELELKEVRKHADIQFKVKRKKELSDNLVKVKKDIDKLNDQMKSISDAKDKKIRDTKMPIKGLAVGESDIIYNGKEFNSLSTSEKMRVAIAIEMADNPKLAIIKVENGNALDEDNKKELYKICRENEYQLWIEEVSSKKTGNVIYIEDGEIK